MTVFPLVSYPAGVLATMARWSELEAAEPDLAASARKLFDAHKHKVLATLRRDGSPGVSGIET